MGVGLFVGVWVARYLGPELFGLFSFAGAFVGLFSAFSTLGLDGIVVRDIVRDSSVKEETIGTCFALKFIGSVATFLIVLGGIALIRHALGADQPHYRPGANPFHDIPSQRPFG